MIKNVVIILTVLYNKDARVSVGLRRIEKNY
jgi:hypothetical protein